MRKKNIRMVTKKNHSIFDGIEENKCLVQKKKKISNFWNRYRYKYNLSFFMIIYGIKTLNKTKSVMKSDRRPKDTLEDIYSNRWTHHS